MKVGILLRRGEGPFWGPLKRLAKASRGLHLPVGPLARPIFRGLFSLRIAVHSCVCWSLRFLWREPLFRSQCTEVGRGLVMELIPLIQGHGNIVLGNYVNLSGKQAFGFLNRWNDAPELIIGDHTFVGHGCSIAVGSSVRIGDHCLLASGVSISDYDGHPIDPLLRRTSPPPPEAIKPVLIGDDVWIGGGARILKGVTIGDRSIVGAGAVVTKSVPPDVIVVGNPARVVKSLGNSKMGRNGASISQLSGLEG